MKELSLNILDIAENSVKAEATLTEIAIAETDDSLTLTFTDNVYGMSEDTVKSVINPFYTTRTTRSVGLGIPLLKLQAEQTGGTLSISSKQKSEHPKNHGTVVKASFNKKHLDYTPLGDVTQSLITLIQGHPETDFLFTHTFSGREVRLDTRELRAQLEDVPLNTYEVIKWVEEYMYEQYRDLYDKQVN